MLWWLAAAVAAGVACGVWAWIEARWFVVRTSRVAVLPSGSEAIRLLHVSDIHLMPRQGRKRRWIRSLIRCHPDVVVLTGDNLADAQAVSPLLESLAPLLRVPGVFVYGSNDYFGPRRQSPFAYFRGPTGGHKKAAVLPTSTMTRGLEDAGWINLNNQRACVEVNGAMLSFVGVDDPHIGRDRMPGPDGNRGAVRIGVAHAPYSRVLSAFIEDGVDLVLAGHTHGGQVRIPAIGALVTNCDLERRRARGLTRWPGRSSESPIGRGPLWLHVSAGVGTSPYAPIRFACRPEVTLLELAPSR